MANSTILLLIFSLIISTVIAFYQYLYKAKNYSKLNIFLAFIRFAILFLLLLLLINPVFTHKKYENQKTALPIVIDNSASIAFLNEVEKVRELEKLFSENVNLKEKYDLQFFSFDTDFYSENPLDFKGRGSNIAQVFDRLKQLYRNQNYPVVLLTDGNQTDGNDYVFNTQPNSNVFPVALGDTIKHLDLKINQLNANKYAFLKNKFPVETFLYYNGNKTIGATFSIQSGNQIVFKQNVTFSPNKKTATISTLLNADRVGVHTYKAVITSKENEKNLFNNTKNFAVEVIDQRSEIALISSIVHPDLGAIKRAIETNAQRKVTIVKPNEIKRLQDYNILILYQPNSQFKTVFDQNSSLNINTFIITGLHTDFNFLSQYQNLFEFRMAGQKEDYSADFKSDFNAFATENIGFEQFPPLENPFGTITLKGNGSTLLQSRIRNVSTDNPLLTFVENGTERQAYLFGENIWKWRMESYLKEKSFEKFDIFLDKTIQYLASNAKKKNLEVTYENFYNSGENFVISAQYFNKNYEFDENAQLTIQLKNKKTNQTKIFDFAKAENDYQVVFDNLEPGQYDFTVKEKKSNTQTTGFFQILDFDIEKQFANADIDRLRQLAYNTQGKLYTPSTIEGLIKYLENTDQYKTLQKEIITRSPLIDWFWGLILLIVLLATEWFVRKYNGLL